MKKFTALLLALAFTALLQSSAYAQVWVQLDATGCFDLQTGPSCTLTPHDAPSTGNNTGEIWTRDCDATTVEGFTCPFDWPIGAATISGASTTRPVTLAARVNINGNGLTTTSVCHEMEIFCRAIPDLSVDTGSDLVEFGQENLWSTANGSGGTSVDVINDDDVLFLFKHFAITLTKNGTGSIRPGSRCELRYRRVSTGGCTDDTAADVGIERFYVEAVQ